jgi:metacaspase-1
MADAKKKSQRAGRSKESIGGTGAARRIDRTTSAKAPRRQLSALSAQAQQQAQPEAHEPAGRYEMISLLGRIVGEGPLAEDVQRQALEMFATILNGPGEVAAVPSALARRAAAPGPATTTAAEAANRRLVYVHGICRHAAGFSDPWWAALRPFTPAAFGPGELNRTRLEVIWSDIVNQARAAMAAALNQIGRRTARTTRAAAADAARAQAADEITETLRDRADRQILSASARAAAFGAADMSAGETSSLISVPGLDCIDDFSIYLTNEGVRQQIIDRFIGVVRPELEMARELDVVGHSWGTVVAYEGLRQLEDEGLHQPLVRNFFTVGAALSIGPVKRRLRPANRNGQKPASVRRWVNLDAQGDLVGGPLKGRPFAVDLDFVNLAPVGCGAFLGLVNPSCAHSSYFDAGNVDVNQSIFARHINQA